jgi:hypothetical protein
MRTLSAFLEQLSIENISFNLWEYDRNQQYRPYPTKIKNAKAFDNILEQRTQWVVEIQTIYYSQRAK